MGAILAVFLTTDDTQQSSDYLSYPHARPDYSFLCPNFIPKTILWFLFSFMNFYSYINQGY